MVARVETTLQNEMLRVAQLGVEALRRTEARKYREKQRRKKQRLYSRFQSLSKEWQMVLIPAHEDEALVRSLVWLVAPNYFENTSHE